MVEYVMERLHEYLSKEDVEVDKEMKKVLDYFKDRVLVTFSATGSDSCPSNYDEKIMERLKDIPKETIFRKRIQLERTKILGYEKGLSSVGGKEFELGFTEKAKDILEGRV